MEPLLHEIAHHLALAIEAVALLVIAIGAVEALIGVFRIVVGGRASEREKRAVWLDFARWLVAGLTFQLAADLVHTTIAPSWDEVGKLAAIAAIRTFLAFFLDRDIEAMREREREPEKGAADAERA